MAQISDTEHRVGRLELSARPTLASRLLDTIGPGFVVLLGSLISIALAASLLNWNLLHSPEASRVALGVACLAAWAVVRLRAGTADLPHGSVMTISALPGLLVIAYLILAQLRPAGSRVAWLLNGDNIRHLSTTANEVATGHLDYGETGYPRGWHTLLATLWVAGGGETDPAGLIFMTVLMATTLWCLYAVFALTTGLLGFTLAVHCGLAQRPAAWCGFAAGAATLWPSMMWMYLGLGFQTSILAAVILAVVAREVLAQPASTRALLVCASGTVAMAHTWQLLLPATMLALGFVAMSFWRRRDPSRQLLVTGVLFATALISLPSIHGVVVQTGLQQAGASGKASFLPIETVLPALLASLGLAFLFRANHRVVVTMAMIGGTAVSALLLAAIVDVSPLSYYPNKLFWTSGALGLGASVVGGALCWGRVKLLSGPAALAFKRVTIGAAAVLLIGCVCGPSLLMLPWQSDNGERILRLASSSDAAEAAIVWVPDQSADSAIARMLLDFYHPALGGAYLHPSPLSQGEECAVLASSASPVVLTTATAGDAEARYSSCAAHVRIVVVP